jgi:large subunit ribosomal protein L25
MANDNRLVAEQREKFGKGAARKLRAAGKIPAVLYGHGTDPQHLALPGHEVMLILRKANAVLELDISGGNQLALVKDVQKDPVRQIIEHVDLVVIRAGERVTVDIPVHVEGEPEGDGVVTVENTTLSIEAEATHIPERLIVSVEGLAEGSHVLASQVELPAGSTLLTDPDTLVLAVSSGAMDTDTDAGGAAEGDEGVEVVGEGGTANDEMVDADTEKPVE